MTGEAVRNLSMRERASAWVALGRVSNLPTVWADALLGVVLGFEALRLAALRIPGQVQGSFAADWQGVVVFMQHGGWVLWLGLSLVYVGGMVLNDWADAARDAMRWPDRPIPSGRIGREAAGAGAVVLLAAGLLLLSSLSGLASVLAGLLVAVVVAYDLLHARWAGSVVLMGLCRGLAILTAGAAVSPPAADLVGVGLPAAAIVTAYVTLLTVVARTEAGAAAGGLSARPTPLRWAVMAAPFHGLLLMVLLPAPQTMLGPVMVLIVTIALARWLFRAQSHLTARPPRIGAAVGWYIAGIAAVDALLLAVLGRPVLAAVAFGLAPVTLLLQRWVRGT